MGNRHRYRRAITAHRRGKDYSSRRQENTMYRMTLKEQAGVLARITAAAPSDRERSVAIVAVRQDRSTATQVALVRAALQRYAELGRGIERSEAEAGTGACG